MTIPTTAAATGVRRQEPASISDRRDRADNAFSDLLALVASTGADRTTARSTERTTDRSATEDTQAIGQLAGAAAVLVATPGGPPVAPGTTGTAGPTTGPDGAPNASSATRSTAPSSVEPPVVSAAALTTAGVGGPEQPIAPSAATTAPGTSPAPGAPLPGSGRGTSTVVAADADPPLSTVPIAVPTATDHPSGSAADTVRPAATDRSIAATELVTTAASPGPRGARAAADRPLGVGDLATHAADGPTDVLAPTATPVPVPAAAPAAAGAAEPAAAELPVPASALPAAGPVPTDDRLASTAAAAQESAGATRDEAADPAGYSPSSGVAYSTAPSEAGVRSAQPPAAANGGEALQAAKAAIAVRTTLAERTGTPPAPESDPERATTGTGRSVATATGTEPAAAGFGAALRTVAPDAAMPTPSSAPATALSTPDPVIEQVTRHLLTARMLHDGSQRSVLHLSPDHLGAVRVTVDVRAGQVRLDLAASDAALGALTSDLSALRSQLADAGLDLADVTLNRQDAGADDGRRPDQRQDPSFGGGPGADTGRGGGDAAGRQHPGSGTLIAEPFSRNGSDPSRVAGSSAAAAPGTPGLDGRVDVRV